MIRVWRIVMMAMLLGGCALAHPPAAGSWRPHVPALTMPPLLGICRLASGEEVPCIAIALRDWEAMQKELQAACAAFGGSSDECLGR